MKMSYQLNTLDALTWRKNLRYQLNTGLGGPQKMNDAMKKKEIHVPERNRILVIQPVVDITTVTRLPRLTQAYSKLLIRT